MPYPLNNAATSDAYTDAATLTPPRPSQSANVVIANAAAMISIERLDGNMRVGAGSFLPEEFKPPGVYTIERGFLIGRIRFRSGAVGVPASISGSISV